MAKTDRPILLEIVRIIQTRARVPEHVRVQNRSFSITYLEDHRQRIEEALRRQDPGQLNMLFGQLESKIKYQVIRADRKKKAAAGSPRPTRSTTIRASRSHTGTKKKAAAKKATAPKRVAKSASRSTGAGKKKAKSKAVARKKAVRRR